MKKPVSLYHKLTIKHQDNDKRKHYLRHKQSRRIRLHN